MGIFWPLQKPFQDVPGEMGTLCPVLCTPFIVVVEHRRREEVIEEVIIAVPPSLAGSAQDSRLCLTLL